MVDLNVTSELDESVLDTDVFVVEAILNKRIKRGVTEYLIKWLGYSYSENTWEPKANINADDLLKKFKKKRKAFNNDVFDPEILPSNRLSSTHKPCRSNIFSKKTFETELHKTANNQIEKNKKKRNPLQLISHTNNEDQTLTKIRVVKGTQRYLNGMEPKIINEFFNSQTGELMYEIKWCVNSKIDTVTEQTAIKKFPQVVVNYKQTKIDSNKENIAENNADTDRLDFLNKSVDNSILEKIESPSVKENTLPTKSKIIKEVIALYDFHGEWKFKVEWTDSNFASEFISANQLKKTHPLDVIKFYEKNLFFAIN